MRRSQQWNQSPLREVESRGTKTTSAPSGLSDRLPMKRRKKNPVYSFIMCAFFLLRSRSPPGWILLSLVIFRSTAILTWCLSAVECLSSRDGARQEAAFLHWWLTEEPREQSWSKPSGPGESPVRSRRHDMTLANSIRGSWERGFL